MEALLFNLTRGEGIPEGLPRRTRVVLNHNSWQLEKLLGRSLLWAASCRFTKKKGVLKQHV